MHIYECYLLKTEGTLREYTLRWWFLKSDSLMIQQKASYGIGCYMFK